MKQQQQQQQQTGGQFMWLCFFVLIVGGSINTAKGADDLTQKCGQVVQKVIPCLEFATGKAPTPKKECCDAANSIKATDPECLCYIIQQTHKGSPESKSMGIQEAKLLQLPSICNVKNASVSNCPKLLGLSPSSPDAAIFTNASKVTPPATTAQQTSSSTTPSPSGSYKLRPLMITDVMVVALAIVLVAVPTGLVSIYT